MLVDMKRDSKEFFLTDTKLGDAIFRFYFFIVIFTFLLGVLLTQRVIALSDFVQTLGIQLLLLGSLLWIRFKYRWSPLVGSFKRILISSFILIFLYGAILFFVDWLLVLSGSSEGRAWNPRYSMIQLFSLLILAPINEELFFRDLLFRSQNSRWKNLWLSGLFSSFAFMVAHLSLYPGAFLLGLISCALFVVSRSIVPSIVFHFLSNASLFFIPQIFPALAQFLLKIGLFPTFYR